ncbi:TonB family protein [Oryzomonas japonica]|uniref:TonB family protein n=2 Tax=Oryzomonas japonica TaxID=2603858 RepID=A0A7J4ZUM0_9BACT|nr:TonB family protein [Oryzomonas japonica]
MITTQDTHDAGMGVSFSISAVIHLAVFLLLLWWGQLFPTTATVQETYYVDVVNLPVANPRAGSPTQKGNDAEAPPPPQTHESPLSMPSPPQPSTKARTAPTGKAQKAEKTEKADTSSDAAFAEKMAKLESKAESQQQEAALERLRKKVKTTGSGRTGMPAGSGSEAGSDYTAYVQSRLKDAFYQTISYTSKNPEVVVHLYIDADGKVTRQKIEKSSGDRTFELSVLRAVEKAGDKLVPPPNHKVFEGTFVFKPKGISRNKL